MKNFLHFGNSLMKKNNNNLHLKIAVKYSAFDTWRQN